MSSGNLFAGVPIDLPEELVEVLAGSGRVRIERIVSRGQHSEAESWYDQEESEWVAVLSGRARIGWSDGSAPTELGPGDWVDIPARRKHRVEWTDPECETVWIAVFY